MNVNAEKGPGQVVLTIEVAPEALERAKDKAYKKLAARANIPGFRRGKAPRYMLDRYLGPTAVLQEAIDQIVPEAYNEAIKSQNIVPYADPTLEITSAEPLAFRATVPLEPKATVGDYQSIRIPVEPVEVTDEQVDELIERLRAENATWAPTERPVQFGDSVTLDLTMQVGDEEPTKQEGIPYLATEKSSVPVPGFAESLVGMAPGESKSFDLTFDEAAEPEHVRGKSYHFEVTVKELKERNLPELDDEFAKSLGADVETVEQLRRRVRESLEQQALARRLADLEDQAIEKLVEASEFEYAEAIVHLEIHRMMDEQARQLAQQGISWERWLEIIRKTQDQVEQELHDPAEKRLKNRLALEAFAAAEELTVDDNEIGRELDQLATGPDGIDLNARQSFDNDATRNAIRRILLRRKALERLMELTTEGKYEELAAQARAAANKTEEPSSTQETAEAAEPAAAADAGDSTKEETA